MQVKENLAISRVLIAIVVVIIVVIAGVTAVVLTRPTSSSSSTSGVSTTSTGSAASGPPNSNQLALSENEPPNSYDPATGTFTGEDEIMTNVYQPLITFNYTSATTFVPILAKSWNVSSSSENYTFNLRQDAYFMNGHAFNASTVWFNFYRVILMNQFGATFYGNFLFNITSVSATGYSLPQGIINALTNAGYSLSSTNSTLQAQQAALALSQILSNFNPSNSTIQKIMSYPNQAVVVSGPYTVQFNLIQPYISFLQLLTEPSNADGMVDPSFVDQHGGVQPNSQNTYVNIHTMGTGPYTVQSYVSGSTITMVANPNYWVAKLPASESNIMLTLPHIDTVIIDYTTAASQTIQQIKSNTASLVEGWPIPSLPPPYLASLAAYPGVKVVALPNAPITEGLMIPFDTLKYPYNITNFRLAIVHAINYSEILDTVAHGYGLQYLGPVTPGLTYYNPRGLPPYSFDPSMSISLLKNLGFTLNLPNGTIINPSGKSASITLTYYSAAPEETKISQEMQVMLSNIGLTLNLNPVTSQEGENLQSQPGTSSSYPGMILWYWFTYWPDPIVQEVIVQLSPYYGGLAGDVSYFDNATLNTLMANLPAQTNPKVINNTIAQVYNIVYQQAPDVWIYAVVPYWIQRSYVAGVFYNPGLQGYYYPLIYYNNTAS